MPRATFPSVTAPFRPLNRFWLPALGLALACSVGQAQDTNLPRPLLDVGGTRRATPAVVDSESSQPVSSATPTPDPLETIRKLRQWRRENPAPPVQVEPTATPSPLVSPLPSGVTPAPSPAVTPRPTTAPELTEEQVKQWNAEARQLQRAGENARASAMYRKVWESDPENRFGLSDMAYINWCGLIVSKNDDGLRREAYARILEFESRFPGAKNLDSAVYIRATLATDLGKVDEATKLLEDFPVRFPDSRRKTQAFELLTSLPAQPGERRITPTPGATRRPTSGGDRISGPSTNRTGSSSSTARRTPTANRSSGTPRPATTARPSGTPRRGFSAYDVPATSRTTPRPGSNPVRSNTGTRQ